MVIDRSPDKAAMNTLSNPSETTAGILFVNLSPTGLIRSPTRDPN